MRKNQEIERLRGIAVLGVILAHCQLIHPYFHPMLRQGWTGVDLFFVISGYVVSLSFLKNLPVLSLELSFFDRLRLCLSSLKNFYLRRIYRILPMAILWAIVPLIFVHFSQQEKFLNFKLLDLVQEFTSIMTFTYNYFYIFNYIPRILGHYWSLSVEEQFYFILPIFYIAVPKSEKRLKVLFILSLLIALVARFLPIPQSISSEDSWMWTRFASHNRFDALLAGVMLYLLSCEINFKDFFKPTQNEVNLISSIAMVGIFIIPGIFINSEINKFNHLIFIFCSSILLFISMLNTGYLLKIKFITPILDWMGARSYGLYLIHVPVEMFVVELKTRGLFLSPLENMLVWIIFTIFITELCYRLIEKPFINLSHRHLAVLKKE